MSDTGGSDVEVPIEVTLNEAQVQRIAERLTTILDQAFDRFAANTQQTLNNLFNSPGVRRGAQNINQAMNQATRGVQADVGSLSTGMQQLIGRAAALRQELSDRGLSDNIFAVYDAALADVLRGQEEFNRRRLELENDPALLAAFEANQRDRLNALRTEVRLGTNILQQEHGRRIVADQRALTLQNTNNRLSLARRLAAEQAAARQRIEIFRFAARQIQFIENQLARALRATASAASAAVAATFRGLGSVGRALRRNNNEFNEGLQGALTRRERAMSESFNRQNRIIRQQSQTIERFNQQASGGLFGFFSGRSNLANALGVGGLIGGGFAAGNLFSQGLDRFTQLERITIQLERLTGSASRTRIILDDLVRLARDTPLELVDVSQAAVGLLAAGTGLRELVPFVRSLADAIGFTGGGAEQLQRVGLAIRQIASIGRLQGEELRQLAESLPGLNIPQLLADQLTEGDTSLLLRMSEQGEISAREFTSAFAEALSSDPRIVGAATATVNTLGGKIAILKESFATLGAAIIEAIEPLLSFSIQGATRRLEFFTDLVRGDVSPALRVLRTALIGVAAGITALLVARAAGEALQFLAIGLRAIITPMGVLVLAAAALGAAFVLLRSNSDAWAAVTERVGRALADMIPFLDVNGDGFASLAEIIQGRIVPALQSLADIAGNVLVRALQVGLGFVVAIVVPGFAFLADLIVNRLIPGVTAFASAVANRAVPVLRTLLDALRTVVDFLDPAIQGFQRLGGAIVDALQGDFSNLFGGLSAAGTGIVTVFANLGVLLFNALRPQIERVVGFISDALGGIDTTGFVVAIGNVARRIGFILGNIVSEPAFINALIRVTLAGAFIAARFLQGFVEGVASNIPGLVSVVGDLLLDLLTGAFRAAISSPQAIISVIAAVLLGPIAIQAFRNIGSNWANLTSDGYATGLKQGARNTVASTRAFFQGADAVAVNAARRTRDTLVREYQRTARDIQAVGGRIGRPIINVAQIDTVGLRQLQTQFRELTRNMTDLEVRALIARRQFNQFFTGVGQLGTAITEAFRRDFQSAGVSVRTGLANIRQSISDWNADLRARGTSAGQVLGAGVLGGIASVFSGAQGGRIGALGSITSGIFTGLSTGSPLIGTAVAGVGLVTNALTAGKRAAEEFAARVDDLATQLANLSDIGSQADLLQRDLLGALTAAFSGAQERALLAALPDNFLSNFTDNLQAGTFDSVDAFRELAFAVGITEGQLQALSDTMGQDSLRLADLDGQLRDFQAQLEQTRIDDPGNITGRADRLEAQIAAIEALQAAAAQSGVSLDTLGQAFAIITAQAELNQDALLSSTEQQRLLAGAVDQTTDAYARSREGARGTADAMERAAEASGRTGNAFLDALRFIPEGFRVTEGFLRRLYDQLVQTGGAMLANFDFDRWLQGWKNSNDIIDRGNDAVFRMGESLQGLADSAEVTIDVFDLVRSAVEDINKARTDQINQRITFLRDQLEGAQEAAARAREELTAFLTGRFQDTPQRLVDELIGSLGDIGSAVEDALIQGGIRGEAGMRVAVGGFEQQLANIIQAGFEAGLRTQGEFESLFAPLFSGLDEEVQDSFARILSTQEFDFGVGPNSADRLREAINRALAGGRIEANIQSIFDADANVARIQRELDFQEAQLNVDLVVDAEQVKAALAAAGIDPRILADITGATVTQAQVEGLAAVVAAVNAQLNGQPTPGQITFNQTNNTNIAVDGAQTPTATAAEIVTKQGAAAGRAATAVTPILAGSRF